MADEQKEDKTTGALPADAATSKDSSEAEKKEEKAVSKKSNRSGIPEAAFVVSSEHVVFDQSASVPPPLRRWTWTNT